LIIPAPKEAVDGPDDPKPVVKFRCPACNRSFATKPELAGKKIRCSGCGAGVRVPAAGGGTAVASTSGPALKTFDNTGTAAESPKSARPRSAQSAELLSTGDDESGESTSVLEDLAAIELTTTPRRAGTVLSSRSEMVEQARVKAAEAAGTTAESTEIPKKKTGKKKKKKKKQTGFFDPKETLKLVAGVGVVVVVLALLAWRVPGTRFPLGGLLCVVGFIVYLLGWGSLKQLVAEEGAFKALLFRFFPPYQWWYVATNWRDTKDYVAFFGAGLLIMSIGGVIIKTSAVGMKAEASERKLQEAKRSKQADIQPAVPSVELIDEN
jgi:hypothetical protein